MNEQFPSIISQLIDVTSKSINKNQNKLDLKFEFFGESLDFIVQGLIDDHAHEMLKLRELRESLLILIAGGKSLLVWHHNQLLYSHIQIAMDCMKVEDIAHRR